MVCPCLVCHGSIDSGCLYLKIFISLCACQGMDHGSFISIRSFCCFCLIVCFFLCGSYTVSVIISILDCNSCTARLWCDWSVCIIALYLCLDDILSFLIFQGSFCLYCTSHKIIGDGCHFSCILVRTWNFPSHRIIGGCIFLCHFSLCAC